jgi:hypothetical protein
MFMTRLVLVAAIAVAVSTTATAQTPVGIPLLRTLPADGTTIANYYKQSVYDPADQKIGRIVDLVIKKDGAVPAAIVSVGGFLGIATMLPFRSPHSRQHQPNVGRTSYSIPTGRRSGARPPSSSIA